MLLPSVLRKSLEMRTLSELSADELGALRGSLSALLVRDLDHCHPSFLPWLAWEFRVDVWNDNWPEAQQRAVIKEAKPLFFVKGTPWAVERALDLTGYNCQLTEWFEMQPEGLRGTFHVDVSNKNQKSAMDENFYRSIAVQIESNKRGSQHWGMRVIGPVIAGTVAVKAYVSSGEHCVIGPKKPPEMISGKAGIQAITVASEHSILMPQLPKVIHGQTATRATLMTTEKTTIKGA